ncbi:MAG: hypothetical protein U0838_16320 [Chloroflexota bacterium]
MVLQPYGSLFFAAAKGRPRGCTPAGGAAESRGTVVVVRLRGRSELGVTFIDVLALRGLA